MAHASKKQIGQSKVKAAPSFITIQPKQIANSLAYAFSGGKAMIPPIHVRTDGNEQRWAAVDDLSNSIADSFAASVNGIGQTVEMVRALGCEHPAEFNILVNKTNEDLHRFSMDFQSIRAKHAGKQGLVDSPDDVALQLQVFEDYMQFRAKFDGVMHHTMISFTEYALEAKDRGMKKLREEADAVAAKTKLAVDTPVTLQ